MLDYTAKCDIIVLENEEEEMRYGHFMESDDWFIYDPHITICYGIHYSCIPSFSLTTALNNNGFMFTPMLKLMVLENKGLL